MNKSKNVKYRDIEDNMLCQKKTKYENEKKQNWKVKTTLTNDKLQ